MNVTPKNREEELLIRVFCLIKEHHFNDHKCIRNYGAMVEFDRNLGDDIAGYVQSKFREWYVHQQKKNIATRAAVFSQYPTFPKTES